MIEYLLYAGHCAKYYGYKDERGRYGFCSHYLEWIWIIEWLSHSVVKGHDRRTAELCFPGITELQQGNKIPTCKGMNLLYIYIDYGRGKYLSYKKDHQQKYRC